MTSFHTINTIVRLGFSLCYDNGPRSQPASITGKEMLAINAAGPTERILFVFGNAYQNAPTFVFVRVLGHRLLQQKVIKRILA